MVSPYATATALGFAPPTYVNALQVEDVQRVQAYWTYDAILANTPEAFAAYLREESDPKGKRYIPFGRAILEGTNRYLGHDLTVTYDVPPGSPVTDATQQLALAAWVKKLFDREQFMVKFGETKRAMLRRGDSFLQLSADTSKPQGQRLRITLLDGAQYFRIPMGTDPERIAGCYIITLLTSADGQTIVAQRERYQRILTDADVALVPGSQIGGIYYRMEFFEANGWDDRFPLSSTDLKPVQPPNWVVWSEWHTQFAFVGFMLPKQIQSIPVYHFKNSNSTAFGYSLLQGLESVLAGITQGFTDEDMTIALTGIGVYWTDSGSPRDPTSGRELDWVIAPASVLELQPGKKFGRVEGVTSVQPIQDHVNALKDVAMESSGTPDIAIGQVNVQVAESGVALAIKMAPVIAGNREREDGMAAILTQFMFDLLNGWGPAYEGTQPIEGIFDINVSFGDAMPVDRASVIAEVVALLTAQIVDVQWAQAHLSEKLGIQFPTDLLARMASAQTAALDAQATRLGIEAGNGPAVPGQPAATPPTPPAGA
jgi:hypothetical protein